MRQPGAVRRLPYASWSVLGATLFAGCTRGGDPAPDPLAGAQIRFPDLVDMVFVPRLSEFAGATGDLLVDRFEVTDGEYAVFLAATGRRPVVDAPANAVGDPVARGEFLAHWAIVEGVRRPVEPDTPVRFLALAEAEEYAAWRGKQLPSHEEWLAGCRLLAEGRLPWQPRAFTGVCNSLASGLGGPMPVGSYELGRSPAGCYDMVGNVAEWTVSTAIGPEKRFLLGGSFERHCLPTGGDDARIGVGVSPRQETVEDRLAPWLDTLAPELRRGDVGFRCVIRDARARLEAAFAEVELLDGQARLDALDELAAVGEWVLEENRLLPRVQMRALDRRIRHRRTLAVEGQPFRGDVRVAPDGATLVVTEAGRLRLLDGRDGSQQREFALPYAAEMARPTWISGPDGSPWTYVVGPAGEIALVALADGSVRVAPAPADAPELDVPTTLVAGAPGDAATWFVQSYVVEADAAGEQPRSRGLRSPRTRIVRFDAAGVSERTLASQQFTPPPPAGPDGLLLLTFEEVPLEIAAGDRDGLRTERLPFAWLTAELVGHDLVTRDRVLIAEELRRAPAGPRRHWRFASEDCRRPPSDLTLAGGAEQFPRALRLPGSYVIDDADGAPWLLAAADGRIAPPRRLAGLPDRGAMHVLTAGDAAVAPPYVLHVDGRQLWRIEAGGATTAIADGLELGEAPALALEADDGNALLLGTRGGQFAGIDLKRRRSAALQGAAGPMIDVALYSTAGAAVVASQSSAWAARWWSLADGALLDSVRLELDRAPVRSLLVVDADRDGAGEPWLLLADGQLLALGPPEARSRALVADFEAAVRRREALRDPGRE